MHIYINIGQQEYYLPSLFRDDFYRHLMIGDQLKVFGREDKKSTAASALIDGADQSDV